jgi:hypothetical protein
MISKKYEGINQELPFKSLFEVRNLRPKPKLKERLIRERKKQSR